MVIHLEFSDLVADAYQHLYDLVRLRTHPLVDVLGLGLHKSRRERAWELHHLLLDVVEELDPGPQAPVYSHEWCRYRLMRLRYVNGIDPPAVAAKIAVSRRQYYREHGAAIEAIAQVLHQRYVEPEPQDAGASPADADRSEISRLELLRLEAAHAAQAARYTPVADVAEGVLSMLREILRDRRLTVRLELADSLPNVAVERGLLRQMLVATLGHLSEHAKQGEIRLSGEVKLSTVHLSATVEPVTAIQPAASDKIVERTLALQEMATLSRTRILPRQADGIILGFDMQLPTSPQPTVLVVDDNEDVLALFQRYLSLHGYQVLMARRAPEALALAREMQPHVITLDLMMPEQDGWEILQVLQNQPETHKIPIVVCSVLRERDLALSLGATAFLEKPITEQALLSVLEALGAMEAADQSSQGPAQGGPS